MVAWLASNLAELKFLVIKVKELRGVQREHDCFRAGNKIWSCEDYPHTTTTLS